MFVTSNEQQESVKRGQALADILNDCVEHYLSEIADEETEETRQCARAALALRLLYGEPPYPSVMQ